MEILNLNNNDNNDNNFKKYLLIYKKYNIKKLFMKYFLSLTFNA